MKTKYDLPPKFIAKCGLDITNPHYVAREMQMTDADKAQRRVDARRMVVWTAAMILAEKMEPTVFEHMTEVFARAIDGSPYRAAWDLGDATPHTIVRAVLKGSLREWVEGYKPPEEEKLTDVECVKLIENLKEAMS